MANTSRSIGQRTKEAVIKAMKHYFQEISEFGFPNSTITMPLVLDAFGQEIRKYPVVIVKILSCRTQTAGIGEGFVKDIFSDDQLMDQKYLPGTENKLFPKKYRPRCVAERYGYLADISFHIQIWGDTVYMRNRVADEVIIAFERFEKQSLMDQGIVIASINQGEDTDFPLNGQSHIFITNITLTVNAELYIDYPVASVTGIEVFVNTNKEPKNNPKYIEGNIYGDDIA